MSDPSIGFYVLPKDKDSPTSSQRRFSSLSVIREVSEESSRESSPSNSPIRSPRQSPATSPRHSPRSSVISDYDFLGPCIHYGGGGRGYRPSAMETQTFAVLKDPDDESEGEDTGYPLRSSKPRVKFNNTVQVKRLHSPVSPRGSPKFKRPDSKPDPIFRSNSPGPGDFQNMRLHDGMLVSSRSSESLNYGNRLYESDGNREDICFHPQGRICRNLRYSLEQLKLNSDKESYVQLVERIMVGPASIRAIEADSVLGINSDLYNRFRVKRRELIEGGLRPSWTESERQGVAEPIGGFDPGGGSPPSRSGRTSPFTPSSPRRNLTAREETGGAFSPSLVRYSEDRGRFSNGRQQDQVYRRRRGVSSDYYGRRESWPIPDIRHQFEIFARWGESRSDGSAITLTQSDKWLRQANVIDGWHLTTTDTAIFFRKYSRGSIWLDYTTWRAFLEELVAKKGLDLQEVIDKLEMCGRPQANRFRK